ncbi:MAG: ribosomal protein S18-alanine N-acetyltransferase [Actinomycetota bacterium]
MAIAKRRITEPLGDVELARMRRRHLRRVMSIESRVYPRPWSATLFLSEMTQKSTRFYLVAKREGIVIGYAGMMYTGREAHVTNIAVDPDVHQRKVGSRLLLALIIEAVAKGSETVSLEVRVTNNNAQAMYQKFGFSVAGVRKGYYVETHEDALVMVVENARSDAYRARLDAISAELDAAGGGELG